MHNRNVAPTSVQSSAQAAGKAGWTTAIATNGVARSGELENDAAAGAISERRETRRVDARNGEESIEPRTAYRVHARGVGQQGHDPVQHRLRLAEIRSASVVVQRERDISALGEDVGTATLIMLKTDSVVTDQHGRPRPLAIGVSQVGDHRQSVDVVLDVLDNDHALTVTRDHRRRRRFRARRIALSTPNRRPSQIY